jgi:hypothetical protein
LQNKSIFIKIDGKVFEIMINVFGWGQKNGSKRGLFYFDDLNYG